MYRYQKRFPAQVGGPRAKWRRKAAALGALMLLPVYAIGGGALLGAQVAGAAVTGPVVNKVLPPQGPTTGTIVVAVEGTNLTSGDSCNYTDLIFCSTTSVSFGANVATILYASPTEVFVEAPAGSLGTVHVTVTRGDQTSTTSSADQFTYVSPSSNSLYSTANLDARLAAAKTIVSGFSVSSVPVAPGPAVSLGVTGLANGPVGPQTVTVTAYDANGDVATGYRGTVEFGSYCGVSSLYVPDLCEVPPSQQTQVPANYTFTAADAGTHTFTSGVTFELASSPETVTATDTSTPTITGSESVDITPGPVTSFVLTFPNETLVAGQALYEDSLTVEAVDQYGNTNPNYNGPVSLAWTAPSGSLDSGLFNDNPTSVNLVNGTVTVAAYPGVTAGISTTEVAATEGGLTGETTAVVDNVDPNLDPSTDGGYQLNADGDVEVNLQAEDESLDVPSGTTFT
ncbi:MAG: IPT/TIG domain-containing protein, partial [Acidimicrobiales bacterium]